MDENAFADALLMMRVFFSENLGSMRRLWWLIAIVLMMVMAHPFVAAQDDDGDSETEIVTHIVEEGDTIDAIAIRYGVTREDILRRNNIEDPRLIFVGQEIVVIGPEINTPTPEPGADGGGDFGPATATTDPALIVDENVFLATPTITPTFAPAPVVAASQVADPAALNPAVRTGVVCVSMFQDSNRNRIHENEEFLLPDGNIIITQGETIINEYTTDGRNEPRCFDDVNTGQYSVRAQAPPGFGMTTPEQLQLEVVSGETVELLFGAAEGVAPAQPPPADDTAAVVAQTDNAPPPEDVSFVDTLIDNSGLLVFGLAVFVLVGGLGLSLIVRRR
ncbi:MAG: LysM peptidoglycan-binding domain-containing protein [Chloroflexi bacterium]|nr:MAG: LysM peptidoglycan-binding domain-containing protein [Chloroflexota bacterium]